MELKVTTLDGEDGRLGRRCRTRSSASSRAPTSSSAACIWQLAKRRAGTHDVKNRAEINRTGKKMYKQKGTGGARHGSARVNLFRGGGRSFGPTPRSHAIDLPKKVRALALQARALGQGQGRRHRRARQARARRTARPRRCGAASSKLGLANALIIDGAEVDDELRARRAQHPEHRRAAGRRASTSTTSCGGTSWC